MLRQSLVTETGECQWEGGVVSLNERDVLIGVPYPAPLWEEARGGPALPLG